MRSFLERLGSYLPATVALALPTVFIPNTVDSFILPRASLVIAGAGIGAGLALLAPGGPSLGRLRLPLIAAAGATLLAFAFSISWPLSLSGAYTRYESLPVRLSYLGLLAICVWCLRSERSRELVVGGLVLGTSIASMEALLQAGNVPFRPDGNIGNANLLGGLIAMAVPLAVARGLRFDQLTVAWWLSVPVMAAALVVSTSRSGGVGALAGCLALVVFSLRGRVAVGGIVASLAAMAAVLSLIIFGPLSNLNNDPARSRLQLWPDGLRMIAARPITGWGLDATGLSFGRYLRADYSPGVMFDRVHSGPLDVAAMTGVVGLVALGWVIVTLFRGVWQWRFSGSVAAFGSACIGYTVWVVFNFDWAPATGAFWLLAGAAWSGVRAAEGPQPDEHVADRPAATGIVRSLAALVAVIAVVAFGVMPVTADAWYFGGRSDLAVVVDPLQARYHWIYGQELVASGQAQKGLAELRRAAELGETEPQLYVDLGDQERALGDRTAARKAYIRALEIDPFYAPAKQRLAAAP